MRIALSAVSGAVGWYRLMGPGFYLQETGRHEVALLSSQRTPPDEWARYVRDADLVVMQGPGKTFDEVCVPSDNPRDGPHWRERKGALVFELDDDMWAWEHEPARQGVVDDTTLARWLAVAEDWIHRADLCITTNERLAKTLRGHGAREVAVCDNAVPPEAARKSPKKPEKTVAIGWSGTSPHRDDLVPVARVLRQLMTWDIRLEVRAIGQVDWRGLDPWRGFRGNYFHCMAKERTGEFTPKIPFDAYYDALEGLNADLAVIPLEPRPFNLGKSAVTLYNWAVKGVPVVCSRTGPYAQAEKEGFPAVYVDHQDERAWKHAIQSLADNPFERERLGQAAQRFVLEHHAFPKAALAWERAFERAHAARAQ